MYFGLKKIYYHTTVILKVNISLENHLLFSKINKGVIDERLRAFKSNLKKNHDYIRECGGLKNIIHLITLKLVLKVYSHKNFIKLFINIFDLLYL